MSVYAIILAGGVGHRMGSATPKQFLNVLGVPVIVHTLKAFENNLNISGIEIVTIPDYIKEVYDYKQKYNISKLKWVTSGGDTCQRSIQNGINNLKGKIADDDIVMICMSVAPLIDDEIIDDSIRVCRKYGNAICGAYSIYNFSPLKENIWSDEYLRKEEHVTLNMPWTFPFRKLVSAYNKAETMGIEFDNKAYTTTLMIDLGEKIYFSKDSQANKLKLTTFDDVNMLEGFLLLKELRKGNLNVIKLINKERK